jgi:glycine C-acetyltransferase
MKSLEELRDWMKNQPTHHEIVTVDSLPNPEFYKGDVKIVSFSTNNYLALATSDRLKSAARKGLDLFGVGNCESRLLGGDLSVYRELESRLAAAKKKESAILFATGYLTNLGGLSGLVRSSLIPRFYGFRPSKRFRYMYFSDEFNHISIREGIRMSEADHITYRHLDLNHLESLLAKSTGDIKIIATDGVFSQDGDIAPLPGLLELAEKYDAIIYVDDAHGTGTLGATGAGILEHFNCYSPRIICMGTLSKAYGSIGGFIATDEYITHILRLTCTAYGFTSAPPPDQAFAVLEAMTMVHDEPERLLRLWSNQKRFVTGMTHIGYPLVCKDTAIVPVLIGDEQRSDLFSYELRKRGFHVDSVKFPAVPKGKARLRFQMNAGHTEEQIDRLMGIMAQLARQLDEPLEGPTDQALLLAS